MTDLRVTHPSSRLSDRPSDLSVGMAAPSALASGLVQFVLDHIQSGIVLHRADTSIVYANKAAATLLGVTAEDMVGRLDGDPIWRFTDAQGAALPIAAYPVSLAISERRPLRDHVVGVKDTADGVQTWLLCNAYPVPEEMGEPREVVVSFTDITALRRATLEHEKSEERLRLILRGINDAPWDWDMVSGALYYSGRWWELMGLSPPASAVTTDFWTERLHPDDRERVKERLSHWLASDIETYEIEYRLLHQDGYYVPVLSRGIISRDENGVAVRISGALMDLTERKRHEAQLHELAYHDILTGLPNRRLFNEKLQATVRARAGDRATAAVLCIDLDRFKRYNDTLGYERSDEILLIIGQRLKRFDVGTDMVARLGSDEFAILFEDLGADRQYAGVMVANAAADIQRAINEPLTINGAPQVVTACIGVAIVDAHADDVATVLRQAEGAMYAAKGSGRGTLRFFDQQIQDNIEERMVMASEFHYALESGQIFPMYQAKVRDGVGIIGAELLIRWDHPARGMIMPAVFIPFCENNGLIVALGRHVLTMACRQLTAWAARPAFSHLCLSVNVSIGELQDPDYEDMFDRIIAATGANPESLVLEITESVLAEDTGAIDEKIQRLRAKGVRFALDDFGTGYSSLSMLLQIRLDELKIDRSFVTEIPDNLNACKVSGIIIDLARQLGLTVVAEGIETQAQLAFLRSRTCAVFQGYLFARAMSIAAFEDSVRHDAAMTVTTR